MSKEKAVCDIDSVPDLGIDQGSFVDRRVTGSALSGIFSRPVRRSDVMLACLMKIVLNSSSVRYSLGKGYEPGVYLLGTGILFHKTLCPSFERQLLDCDLI